MPDGCLLFDLDGTLVDSLPDLTTAINLLRADHNLPPLTVLQVRNYVGDGASALVQRSLPEGLFCADELSQFLGYYQHHLCDLSAAYPGVAEMLTELHQHPLVIVTNKPVAMAKELLEALNLLKHFQLVLGGDSCCEKKPHPTPLIEALRQVNCTKEKSLMVGDHHTDLRAAAAAGIEAIFCSWGYGNNGDETPAFIAGSVTELRLLLGQQ